MVEALDAERCDAIAAEIMEKPEEKFREQNENTKIKITEIALTFFSGGQATTVSSTKTATRQLPTNIFGKNWLEDSVNKFREGIVNMIQKEGSSFDRIDSLVTITADGNEVFRENKTFDQLGLTAQAS